jgi:hypothetical protein
VNRDAGLLGISSGSLPALSAAALAATVRDLGGGTVDLRWGKGHGWEEGGLGSFGEARVSVAFIGASVALGSGDPVLGNLEPLGRLLDGWPPVPVKVFAAADLDKPGDVGARARDLAGRQAAVLTRLSGVPPLVETHHGYASLASLGALCTDFGCQVLLDVYGLHQLTGGFHDETGTLRRWASAAQVKGFEAVPGGHHRPLALMPAQAWALLDELPATAPVTVESRSGTLHDDLALLRRWCSAGGEQE